MAETRLPLPRLGMAVHYAQYDAATKRHVCLHAVVTEVDTTGGHPDGVWLVAFPPHQQPWPLRDRVLCNADDHVPQTWHPPELCPLDRERAAQSEQEEGW